MPQDTVINDVDGTLYWLDGSGGSDSNSGLTRLLPIKTNSKLASLVVDGDGVVYKNIRETLRVSANRFSFFLWDVLDGNPAVPCPRGDTVVSGTWTNISGNIWWILITPLSNAVGCVVWDYDICVQTSYGARPAHLKLAANYAGMSTAIRFLVDATKKIAASGGAGTFTLGETVTQSTSGATGKFAYETGGFVYLTGTSGTFTTPGPLTLTGGTSGATRTGAAVTSENRLYVNNGADPNAHVVAYTAHAPVDVPAAMLNGIEITGDNSYIEAYPALWTEGGGSSRGGWGVLVNGNNPHIKLFGAESIGYKAAAVACTGSSCGYIECVPGSHFASFSNQLVPQGVTSNGNAMFTFQGGGVNVTSGVLELGGCTFAMNTLLGTDGQPLVTLGDGTSGFIINHGTGSTLAGIIVRNGTIINPFGQVTTYGGTDNQVAPTNSHDKTTYNSRYQNITIPDGTNLTINSHVSIEDCTILLPNATDADPVRASGPLSGQKVLFTNCVIFSIVHNGGELIHVPADSEWSFVHTTLVDSQTAASQNRGAFRRDNTTTSHIYVRDCLFWTPTDLGFAGFPELIIGESVASNDTTIDIHRTFVGGYGVYDNADLGTPPTLPAYYKEGTPVGTGAGYDNYFAGNVASTSIFRDYANHNFRLRSSSPSQAHDVGAFPLPSKSLLLLLG